MYIEGYNFAEDHQESEFFNSLGCDYIADGNEGSDIYHLDGKSNTFVEKMYFDYGLSTSPRVRPDVISANDGELLFCSQDSNGYAIAFDNGNYKTITSTFLFGALIDDSDQNTKVELMRRYLQFFEGTLSVDELDSKNKKSSGFQLSQNYPNPFYNTTLIKFQLDKSTNYVSLKIFNMLGQEVKSFNCFNGINGLYSLNWDGTNNHNEPLPTGTYIYQMKVGERSFRRKMNLIR